jgi:Ribonuclease HepT-like
MIFRELFIKGRLMKQVILKRFEVSDETIYFVHDYEGVNLERLWDTAIQDIPAIRNAVEKYLRPHTQEGMVGRNYAPLIPGDELP